MPTFCLITCKLIGSQKWLPNDFSGLQYMKYARFRGGGGGGGGGTRDLGLLVVLHIEGSLLLR